MKSLDAVKQDARASAVTVCRAAEAKLQMLIAADGGRILGLPNLGTGTSPYHGLRVRAEYPDERLAAPEGTSLAGVKTLCLDTYGRLVMARMVKKPPPMHVEAEMVTDAELLAEDGGHVAEVVQEALESHMKNSQQTRARFEALTALNTALAAVLDGDKPRCPREYVNPTRCELCGGTHAGAY